MKRRDFITGIALTAAWPLDAYAQHGERMRRVGLLTHFSESDPEAQSRITAFRTALRELGWVQGKNLRIDYRYSAGDIDRLRTFAVELTALSPDALHSIGSPSTTALRDLTHTIPIVFAQVTDPLGSGLIDNMARPTKNITGFTNYDYDIGGKWLEMLKEIAPSVTRVLVVYNSANVSAAGLIRAIQVASALSEAQVSTLDVRHHGEKRSVDVFAREAPSGLIVLPDATSATYREDIISSAARHRTPAIFPHRAYVASGGLISYGIMTSDQSRQAAAYVDRILKGEKPSDLPIQSPTKYELAINLNTAKALGLEVPPTLLARANEVIE
jgi:putative ABC transport system substrate-binding protein